MPKLEITSAKGLVQRSGTTNISLSSDVLVGTKEKVFTLSGAGATKTLVAADSGAFVILSGTDASIVTLPAHATGLAFKVFVGTPALAHVISASAASDTTIQGAVWDNTNGTTVARTAVQAAYNLTIANGLCGDWIDFESDGSNWQINGWVNDTPAAAT